MNTKVLATLEYDKVLKLLVSYASSAPGKELCRDLVPFSDPQTIEQMQSETADALAYLFRKGSVSFGSVYPVAASLKRSEIGGALNTKELLTIAKLLHNTSLVKQYGKPAGEDASEDSLSARFASLEPVRPLKDEIERVILSEEEIADDASPRLKQIRREMRLCSEKIRGELTKIMTSGASYLQDNVITTRNGRYCIPVKSGAKGQVSGIVHDQSASGSTCFIEPSAVVELNNKIRELEIEEKKEIERILAELTERVRENADAIAADYSILVELDFIFARAHLAKEQNATRPLLDPEKKIELKGARHPLISKDRVVPIDVRLGDPDPMLIITGPNTGGKTVSLKTTGLMILMGLSGLHIPALENSRIPVFTEVFADIGDEQSIEQNLSTFSGHITNVIAILKAADKDSFLLFDELGSGTDPVEGAALARAILTELNRRGICTMATTHYSELKQFALRTPGVVNGACEFDVETLSPTYRLLIGVPGKSNAFLIVKRLGMEEDLIEEARSYLTEQHESFEDLLGDLEAKRASLEEERQALSEANKVVAQLKADLSAKKERIEKKHLTQIEETAAEARRILEEAKEFADETIRYYAKQGPQTSMRDLEERRSKVREKIRTLQPEMPEPKDEAKKPLAASQLMIGDTVRIRSMNLTGTVNTLPDDRGNLFVTAGIMRIKTNLNDLEKTEEEPDYTKGPKKASGGSLAMSKSYSISPEINLLGKTVDEAVAELDKYLDEARLSHLTTVRIVHGKGTGALRAGVHNYLKKNRQVRSFRLAEYGEGDSGVTVAELKS